MEEHRKIARGRFGVEAAKQLCHFRKYCCTCARHVTGHDFTACGKMLISKLCVRARPRSCRLSSLNSSPAFRPGRAQYARMAFFRKLFSRAGADFSPRKGIRNNQFLSAEGLRAA